MKVYIQLENSLVWNIVGEDDTYLKSCGIEPVLIIDPKLLEQAKRISKEFYEVQEKLELLYRVQEGLKPRDGDGQPPLHIKITKKQNA